MPSSTMTRPNDLKNKQMCGNMQCYSSQVLQQEIGASDKFRRRMRSAYVDTCIVPMTRTRFGDRIEFLRCRPPDLEQLTAGTATARH